MCTIHRRNILAAAAFGAVLGPAGIARAGTPALEAAGRHSQEPRIARAKTPRFQLESDRKDIRSYHAYHEGLGTIDIRMFNFGRAAAPANFLIYDIPVGASEGVHVHNLTDPRLGPYDEYYYIIEGQGTMTIDGEKIVVTAGDHIHTPLEVPHGIENMDGDQRLKVLLTYIDRSTGKAAPAGMLPG